MYNQYKPGEFTFTYNGKTETLTKTFTGSDLFQVLQHIESFLAGCGYKVEKSLVECALPKIDLSDLKIGDIKPLNINDIPTLTTADIVSFDLSGIAPLTSEQIKSFTVPMPGTIGSAKVSRGNYGNDAY